MSRIGLRNRHAHAGKVLFERRIAAADAHIRAAVDLHARAGKGVARGKKVAPAGKRQKALVPALAGFAVEDHGAVAEYERRVDGEFVPDGIIRANVPPRGDREKAALVHEMLRRAPVFLRHGSAVLRAECVVKIRNEQISFKFSVSHWYFSQNYV